MTRQFAPCQEVWTPLSPGLAQAIAEATCEDEPPAGLLAMFAFVTPDGILGLWDGSAAWLSSWDTKRGVLRSGDARLCIKSLELPPILARTAEAPASGWHDQDGRMLGPATAQGQPVTATAVELPNLPHAFRVAETPGTFVALLCGGQHARALLWKLPQTWDAQLSAPPDQLFTGEMARLPFALTSSRSRVVEAELLGMRGASGKWGVAHRFWHDGRACQFQAEGESQQRSLFRFGPGEIPPHQLPVTLKTTSRGLEWSCSYVEKPGYISVNAIDQFVLDPKSGRGTFSHSTWEEH